MTSDRRQARLHKTIRRILSEIISEELPLTNALITITEVKISVDIQWVDVSISIFPYHKKGEIMKALQRKVGFLQFLFNKKLKIHHTPKIRFVLDSRLEAGIIEGT